MRVRATTALALTVVLAGVALPSHVQAQPAATYDVAMYRSWTAEHNKILDMAKDFPAELYESRPHADSRTFLDEIRHVTIGLEMSSAQMRGEEFDYFARVEADKGKPATRESLVTEMEAAIAESYPMVETEGSPILVGWLSHQAEHYGKLVTIYRLNGLIPPASRN